MARSKYVSKMVAKKYGGGAGGGGTHAKPKESLDEIARSVAKAAAKTSGGDGAATAAKRKKPHYHGLSTSTRREINKCQRRTKPLLPQAPFVRVLREALGSDTPITAHAARLIQEAVEIKLREHARSAYALCGVMGKKRLSARALHAAFKHTQ